jgi:hypothetical protein
MAHDLDVRLQIGGSSGPASFDLGSLLANLTEDVRITLTEGVGSSQFNTLFQATLDGGDAIPASSYKNIDLLPETPDASAILVTDYKQDAVDLASVKFLLIVPKTAGQVLTIGGVAAGSGGWNGWCSDGASVSVPYGSFFLLASPGAGYVGIAEGTDLLKIANSSGSACEVDIIIAGVAA